MVALLGCGFGPGAALVSRLSGLEAIERRVAALVVGLGADALLAPDGKVENAESEGDLLRRLARCRGYEVWWVEAGVAGEPASATLACDCEGASRKE